ncbi:Crp/Fnr family transcriptional regulator [Sulfuriferula thiophila]|uniref:Crp/Fnr family transcriptional regulator n=1 Tax=Sulfuriferula thiophila TaxID=1781211 RepID=UPI000F605340|nr:Crp/Fnr family transcriptional regulator [Sulfuriferula thiophila]
MPATPDIKDFRLAHLFRDLQRDVLAQIARHAAWRELAAGEALFAKGDTGKQFFLVKTGAIKLFLVSEEGEEHIMEIIGRERLFAEAVMFMGGSYPVYATALEPSRLIAFDAYYFTSLLQNNPSLCLTLLATMSRQMHALVAEIDRLTLQSSTRRLAQYLLAQPAYKSGNSRQMALPASKQTIASLLDIRPETLSRILARLADDGLIAINAEHITILQPALLDQVL